MPRPANQFIVIPTDMPHHEFLMNGLGSMLFGATITLIRVTRAHDRPGCRERRDKGNDICGCGWRATIPERENHRTVFTEPRPFRGVDAYFQNTILLPSSASLHVSVTPPTEMIPSISTARRLPSVTVI